MSKKRLLITGSTGFIGTHFIERYKGDFDLYHLVRDFKKNLPGNQLTIQDLKNGALEVVKPDYLLHLAAKAAYNHSIHDIEEFINSNITFPSLVLESFIKSGGKKVLNVGSYWQHANNKLYKPNSFYAATKQAFEDIIDFYVENEKCEVTTVKLFDTYGPNDPRTKILQLVYLAAKNNKPLSLTSGTQFVYLTHVNDVIEGLNHALQGINPGHAKYFLRPTKPRTLKNIIEIFLEINNLTADLRWGELPHSARDFFQELDILPDLPNWNTTIPLEIGLKKLF